ncbi:MAG TPA: hypothetical protein VEI97_16750, partial [bacterium]|nr:hypothetical protein [bacterium]
ELGMGHVVRSLRLMLELESAHRVEGYFIGRWLDGADGPLWRRHPLRLLRFVGPLAVPHDDIEWFADRADARLVLFDLLLDPLEDTPLLAKLRGRGVKVATLHEHAFPWANVDLAINPSVIEQEHIDGRPSIQGAEYLLVDPAYGDPPRYPRRPKTMAIVLGGADPGELTRPAVDAVLAHPAFADWRITLVLGPAAGGFEPPSDLRVSVERALPGLVQLFQESEVAITNGGTTCYEALAAGCKVAAIPQNEFEDHVIGVLFRHRALLPWYAEGTLDRLTAFEPTRVVDGQGVRRVAAAVAALL